MLLVTRIDAVPKKLLWYSQQRKMIDFGSKSCKLLSEVSFYTHSDLIGCTTLSLWLIGICRNSAEFLTDHWKKVFFYLLQGYRILEAISGGFVSAKYLVTAGNKFLETKFTFWSFFSCMNANWAPESCDPLEESFLLSPPRLLIQFNWFKRIPTGKILGYCRKRISRSNLYILVFCQ